MSEKKNESDISGITNNQGAPAVVAGGKTQKDAPKKRQRFHRAVQVEAARTVLNGKLDKIAAARYYKTTPQTITNWVEKHGEDIKRDDEMQRLKGLETENTGLKKELEDTKKQFERLRIQLEVYKELNNNRPMA